MSVPLADGGEAAPGPAGTLALVDGHSLLHRAFFALPALTGPQGQPTGALHGFFNMLFRLCADEEPTHLAVALDRPEPTFRHREFADYKAQRAAMPSDLATQVPLLREVLTALGIATVEHPGAEADDVIGTLATGAAEAGFRVLIVTGDRDALQLVSPAVTVLYTRRGIREIERMDVEAVLERYGVPPEQLVDVKALCGDASDNYPGVPAVGEKTACRLVAQYGTVEDLYRRLAEVGPPRVARALEENESVVRRNKRLATISRSVPAAFDPTALRRRPPDLDRALPVLEGLGLRAIAARAGVAERPAPPAPADVPRAEDSGAVLLEAGAFRARLAGHAGRTAVAAAWAGERPEALGAWLEGAADGDETLAWRGGAGEAPLPPLQRLVAHDAKRLLRRAGPPGEAVAVPDFDGALAGYLLDAERSAYPLEDLCAQAGVPAPAAGDLGGAAAALGRIRSPLLQALRDNALEDLYVDVELPLIPVLVDMERRGVLVDRGALEALEADFEARLRQAEADVHALAGEPFNISSTQQLGRILFDRIGLKPPKKTKTGFSTDGEVLEQLAAEHPLPAMVLTYRSLQKLQSTYVKALPGYIEADGRIRSDFRQTVTATGRLSSNNPNLQNIPIRDDAGRPIRRVFVAPPGWRLVSADYSQVELRVLAHCSDDPGLITAFREGHDIHRATAAEVWGVPPEDVTAAQRSAAKAINFGIVYGISDFGLARQLGRPVAEAREIIARYGERFPGVQRYMDRVVAEARATGQVRTLSGRLRRLPDITSRNFPRRAFAERMAMNTPIQGTAADLIKAAMVGVHRELRRHGLSGGLILQVHDELVVEAPEAEVPEVAAILRREMEGAAALAVPLVVEVRAGPNWLDLRPCAAGEGDGPA